MEELKENKSVVTSYRLTQDTKDKVQQQLKDLGVTQEQYFNRVVSLMELENVKQNGFIAQDVEKLFPNLVYTRPDGFKTVDYEMLVPSLTEAIKELKLIPERF